MGDSLLLHLLFDPALVHLPFQGADVIDKKGAVKMIQFVLNDDGQKPVCLEAQGVAVPVGSFHENAFGPSDVRPEIGHAQAAFVFRKDFALAGDDLRIDQYMQVMTIFSRSDVVDDKTLSDAHLGGGEAHTGGHVHGRGHAVENGLHLTVDILDGRRPLFQETVRIGKYV